MRSSPHRPPLEIAALLGLVLATALTGASAAGELAWHDDLSSARAEAERLEKVIVVDLVAEWCHWCKVLDEKIFTSEPFAAFAEEYVLLRLDVDRDEEGQQLQVRHGVDKLPTTLLLAPGGAEVGRVEGVAPTARYLERMRSEVEEHEGLLERYEEALDGEDPRTLVSLAEELHRRSDGARAARLYRRLLELDWQAHDGPAALSFRLADALRLAGRYEEALEATARARQLAETDESEKLLEVVDLLRIRIARDRGDCTAERTALELFLDEHPGSSRRQQVRHHLSSLEGTDCA